MKQLTLAVALFSAASGAYALDIDQLEDLGQREFRLFSEDLGAALSYKALAPAEPLGITGFDIGVEVTATSLANKSAFETATGDKLDSLPIPKVHLHKGLPLDIDVGAFYASVPGSSVTFTGAELRYAFLDGGIATPAVAVRGTWTSLSGVDELDLTTKGLELTISKGFAMVTPYAGIGQVWVDSEPNVTGLEDESFTEGKYYAGLNINAGLMNFVLEADKTGEANTLGAKIGFRW
jgi:hypothetical protein